MMPLTYTPKTVVPLLFRRLGQMLPDHSTGSIEDNELFRSSKEFLMGLTGSGLCSDVFYGAVTTLQDILGDSHVALESRNERSLSIILVFTRLLVDLLTAEWDAAVENVQSPVIQVGRERDKDYLFEGRAKFYSHPPAAIHSEVAAAAIDLFMRLKSTIKLNHVVHHVLAVEVPSDQRSPNHSRHLRVKSDYESQIHEIDANCENIVFYLTASNWNEAYEYTVDRLKSLKHTTTEEVEAIPGFDILGLLYLDHDRLLQLVRDLGELYFPNIRRTIHRLAVQHFLYQSIMYWIIARGSDAVFTMNGSDLSKAVDPMFDYMFKMADSERKSHTTYVFLSVLLVLLPESFSLNGENRYSMSGAASISSVTRSTKSKSSTKLSSKKLIYLETLSRAFKSANPLERTIAATSYMTFCKTAASIYHIDASHPLVNYAINLYRDLLNALFGAADRHMIYSNLDRLQSQFVSSFAQLLFEDVQTDLMPVLQASTAPVRFQRNILRGFLNLHTLQPSGNALMGEFVETNKDNMMAITTMLTSRYRDQETGNVRRDPVALENLAISIKYCFLLFMCQPQLFFMTQDVEHFSEITNGFTGSVILATTSSFLQLRETAMAFCFDLIESEKLWSFAVDRIKENPTHIVYHLYRAFGLNAKEVAHHIMHQQDLNDTGLEVSLKFIKRYMESRTDLVHTYRLPALLKGDITKLEKPDDRLAVSRTIETCMLVCLCSSNMQNCKLALQNIYALVQEASAVENFDKAIDSHWSIMPNINVYSEISAPNYVVTGPIAVQKRLFKWLQLIDDPSPAMVKAWALIYDRWIMISVGSFDNDQDKQREWKSYSGFLCSLLSPLLNLDGQVRIPDNAHFKARQFLKEIIELLLSDSPYVRETVKEVLARDASPLVFHHVFKHLNDMIDMQLTGDRKTLDPKDVRLSVQTTSLITSVIERLYDGEVYLSVDIGALALKIVRFLKDVDTDTELIKLEIRICQLLEVVGFYKDTLNMKHELRVRNEFVMVLSEWLEKSTAFKSGSSSSDRSTDKSVGRMFNEMERLVRDKTVAIVKALTQLLDGLPIDVTENVHEKDILATKSNIFSNLFSLFLRVLNRVKAEEEGRNEGMLNLSDKIPFVRKQVILALSNLLNANVDVGLKIALNLGYHDDLNLRLAFLEIFKNILTQGTKFSAEYNENKRYEELVDIVVNNRQIALTLCDICPPSEVDDFSIALLNVFDSRHQSLELVKDVVTREIEHSDSPQDVLRRNCVATKLLAVFARNKGFKYLQSCLGPFLNKITNYPDDYAFEIEPDKLKDYQEFKDNLNNFEKCLTEIISSLERTINTLPNAFRDICHTIQAAVEPLFPESKETAVSGFFFLRFICPALVAPDVAGLLDKPPSKQVRRSLLLLVKCIQNMANGSVNPVRLAVVSDRIAMIEQKTESMLKMLRNICELDIFPNSEDEAEEEVSLVSAGAKSLERPYAVALHKFLYAHWEDAHHRILMDQRMRRLIASRSYSQMTAAEKRRRSSSAMGSTGTEESETEASRRLTSVIRSLGRPSTSYSRQLPSNLRYNTPHRLYDFMSRNALRDLGPVIDRRIVHEGVSNDGTPVLVMTGRNYNKDQTDTELVLYRFFQVASKMWSDKFYLFYDGTGFQPSNLLPTTARSASDIMIPDEMAHNCAAIYFYNVHSEHLPRLKQTIRHYQNGLYLNPLRTKYVFLTPDNIGDYFDVPSLNLDDRSTKVINDTRFSYGDVQKVVPGSEEVIDVSLRLGTEYLQIRGEQPFNYIPHSPGFTNDTFRLSDITEVYMSNNGYDNEFTVELAYGSKVILISKMRYEIIRAIQNAKSRLRKEESEPNSPKDAIMRVEDAMGRLLNMGLANLRSNDAAVQLAAYNLLATLPARFDIDFGRELRGGAGLAIPKNEITMAVSFSEAVSISHPDLTLEFLTEFFNSYQNFSIEGRQNAILYAVPWIKNVYKYVYLADEENGPENTATLVRQCLDITIGNTAEYNCLLSNVWPVLSLEESLVDILVNEVVEFAVDRGPQDEHFEDALAVVTSFPTVSVCGTVLMRIRRLLAKPLSTSERSLVNHPNWTEIVVLVKMMSFLSFESITIAEMFLPEIFLAITTFLYTGSYSFRASLHSLLVNVVHSFSCSPNLSQDRKDHIVNIWHDLCSAKGKLLFGLSDEMRPMNYDYFVLAAVKHIESCCMVLMDILTTVGSAGDANVWRGRWCSFVMRSCFVECPALQCRSFLVLGCLARIEVEDSVVSKVLDVLKRALHSEMLSLSEEYAACTLFCLTKMVDGLPANSQYHVKLFWLALSILRSSSMTLFGYAISLLQASLRALDDNSIFKTTSIAEYLMQGREVIEEEWAQLDELAHIKFSVEFFDTAICATIYKGLERSMTRANTLKALETFLEISAKNNVKDRQSDKRYPSYLSYLYFLYLGCRSDNDLKDLLWVAGYPEDHLPQSADAETVPTLLKEYLSDDSPDSTITLFLGGQLFRTCNEYDSMDLRFLESLRAVGDRNVEKKAMVYSMVRDKILKNIEQGSNNRIMEAVLNVGGGVLANVELFSKLPQYQHKLQSLLIGSGFEGTLMELPALNGSVLTEEEQIMSRERFAALVGKMLDKRNVY